MKEHYRKEMITSIVKTVFLVVLTIGVFFLTSQSVFADSVSNEQEEITALQAGETITKDNTIFKIPNWTNKNYAVINFEFVTMPDKISAKLESSNEWTDITVDKNFKITENGLIYLKTVIGDNEVIQSEYIECFDRVAPRVSYSQDGLTIYLSAIDGESGVQAFYVNDTKITNFTNSGTNVVTAEYTLSSKNESVMIYAEDKAGNVSTTTNIKGTTSSSSSQSSSSNSSSSNSGKIGNSSVSITVPEWTNKESALVKVTVSGKSLDTVEARIGKNGKWTDITSTMDFTITENNEVYVRVTDVNGSISTVSETINCFDRVAPTVKLTRDGDKVNVLAIDEESGIKVLYVNGKPYTTDNTTITITESMTISAQARDNAGNVSAVATLKVTGKSGTASSSSADSGTTTGQTKSDTGTTTQIIQVGGENYTIEELQNLGIPIYVISGVDEQTIKDIFDTQYTVVNQENIVTYEQPLTDDNLKGELSENEENSGTEIIGESTTKTKKTNSPIGFVLLAVIVAIGAGVFLFYYKRHAKKVDKNDMYENDYDPEKSLYDDDFDEESNYIDDDIEY